MKFLKNFLNNINWTGTLCRRAGLTMAALLIFLVALSSRAPKSSADKDDSSSKTVQESSSQQEIKIDTTYVKVNNDELKNTGLIALDNKDHSYTPDTSGFESIYSYLFNAKGDMVMTTGSTSICGNKEMLEHLNAMVSDFAAQTGLKTIMVRNAAYRVDDKVYKSQFDVEQKKQTAEDNADAPEGNAQPQQQAAQTEQGPSADGCYEHLTGLAVDLQLYEADKGTYPEFTGEGSYAWINDNCWKYGFVLRYPAEKQSVTGVEGKKNHYRYVGKEYAQVMHENNLVLEELYAFLQKYTYEKPLKLTSPDGSTAMLYYVKKDKDKTATTIPMPTGKDGGQAGHFSADSEDGIYVCGYIDSAASPEGTPAQTQQAQQAQPQQTQPAEAQAEKTE